MKQGLRKVMGSLVLAIPVLLPSNVFAQDSEPSFPLPFNYEVSHEVTGQWRGFEFSGFAEQHESYFSLEYLGEFVAETEAANDVFILSPKLRVDQHDSERNLIDLQKAYWNHLGDGWELRAGVHKVFWGVTESAHLVDIINQTDLASAIDQEDKLGQGMINVSVEFDEAILDVFVLAGHRERTFSGEEGRFRTFIPVDTDHAQYESSKDEERIDLALRWVQTIDDTDVGVHVFSGTSREPLLLFNNNLQSPSLLPYYPVINQVGLDVQHVYESWLLKLEAIYREGMEYSDAIQAAGDDHYYATVAGFEYTQVGIFDSAADLGWIGEYLYDSRGKSDPMALFEDDWFAGWRLAFNDMDDSELLAGLMFDPTSSERTWGFEYSQRLSDNWSMSAEARIWQGGDKAPQSIQQALQELQSGVVRSKFASVMTDDYIDLKVTYYF